MEKVIITETKGGNPKYIIDGLNVVITALKTSDETYNVNINHRDLSYIKITGKQIKKDRHTIFIKCVSEEVYPTFCESLLYRIKSLSNRNIPITEIVQEIYNEYHNETETKKEVSNIQEKFKKLNKEYKAKLNELTELAKEMDYMCKQMEML